MRDELKQIEEELANREQKAQRLEKIACLLERFRTESIKVTSISATKINPLHFDPEEVFYFMYREEYRFNLEAHASCNVKQYSEENMFGLFDDNQFEINMKKNMEHFGTLAKLVQCVDRNQLLASRFFKVWFREKCQKKRLRERRNKQAHNPHFLTVNFVPVTVAKLLTPNDLRDVCLVSHIMRIAYRKLRVEASVWYMKHKLGREWHVHIKHMFVGMGDTITSGWPRFLHSIYWHSSDLPQNYVYPLTLTHFTYYIFRPVPQFPPTLRSLKLIGSQVSLQPLTFPPGLEELCCDQMQFKVRDTIPSLRKLTLTGKEAQTCIDLYEITPNLTTLVLSFFLNNISFPSGLRCLHIDDGKWPPLFTVLPQSLQVLDCGNANYKFRAGVVPETLQFLHADKMITNRFRHISHTTKIKVNSKDGCEFCGCKIFAC